jgi:DNA-binding beta-propeller fold protein YncE
VTAASLYHPQVVAVDRLGTLYVADSGNNRVLVYDAPLASDTSADRVFGQPNLSSGASNNGGVTAASLYNPIGVAVDARGNLYVADFLNNRVLEYDWLLNAIRLPLLLR